MRSVPTSSPVDVIGLALSQGGPVSFKNGLAVDPSRPGIVVTESGSGFPLVLDRPGPVTVQRDADAYSASGGEGILLVHFHNTVGHKASVVSVTDQ